jgi:hypothetical protein
VLAVAPDGTVRRGTSLYGDTRDPEHPPLALFAGLDRAVALKSTYVASGECVGLCTSNNFLPVVSSAGADGTPYTVATAFGTPLRAWGAPCVLYRRPEARIRLASDPAGPDVWMCAR